MQNQIDNFINNLSSNLYIPAVYIFFENGETIKTIKDNIDYKSDNKAALKKINTEKVYMENVFIHQDKPYIEMYHQVRAEDGSKGVVAFICSFEFDNIFNEFTNKNLIGRFYIINNDNIIIATLEKNCCFQM